MFLDIERPSASVPHDVVFSCLNYLPKTGDKFRFLAGFCSNCTYCVRLNLEHGVPQDSCLDLVLFNIVLATLSLCLSS